MRRRMVVAALSGAAFAASAVVATAAPAGAQEEYVSVALVGNFVGGPEEEMFLYDSEFEDLLVSFSNGGVPGGEITIETYPFQVNGLYYPTAGDFDGDGYDEIFWYGPGTRGDSRWDFNSTSSVTSTPYTVNGANYWPEAGNFLGDDADDIFWYGAGSVADSLWDFEPGGTFTTRPQSVGGNYWPIVGSYGSDATDDLFWWSPGTPADYLWDLHPDGSHGSAPYAVNGTSYFPFSLDIYNQGAGGGDLYWYLPGTGTDYVWDFEGGVRSQFVQNVSGDYYPVAGNFLGEGCDDIVWFGFNGLSVWDYSCTPGGGADRYIYNFTAAASTTAPRGEPAPSAAVVQASPRHAAAVPG